MLSSFGEVLQYSLININLVLKRHRREGLYARVSFLHLL